MQGVFWDGDVIVAGGGPAGLRAAREAARGGARVLLLEKRREIGLPVRTSGASWIEDLKRLGVPERYYHPTHRVRLVGPEREVRFRYDPPINCVLDVTGLYQHLAVEAGEAGAEIRLSCRVKRHLSETGEVKLATPGGEVRARARVVIDASGHAATLAREAGLAAREGRVGFGAEYELHAPARDPDEIILGLGTRIAPGGYAWIFPLKEGRVRVGVGVLRPDTDVDVMPCLERFVEETRPPNSCETRLELHHGIIPAAGPLTTCVGEDLIVAGDAAGHVLGTAGEGIRFALELGAKAGLVAALAAAESDRERRQAILSSYQDSVVSRHQRLFQVSARLNRHLSGLDDERWDRALGVLDAAGPGLARRLMHGDFFGGSWFTRTFGQVALKALSVHCKS